MGQHSFIERETKPSVFTGVILLASTITQNNEIVALAFRIASVESESN